MSTTPIGWAKVQACWTIKQGESGGKRFTQVVTNDDGSPLASYDGWSAELVLTRRPNPTPEVDLEPTVVGDAGAQTLTADVLFDEGTTADLATGALTGDLVLIDPQGGRHYPANISLQILRSYGPTA